MAAHKHHKHQCWSADVHYKYIETPLYVAQNRFDSNQAGSIFGAQWWPTPLVGHKEKVAQYVRYFGQQTLAGIVEEVQNQSGVANQSSKHDGLFLPSCYQHTGNLCMVGGSLVQNVTYGEALGDWFVGKGGIPPILVDDCNGKGGTQDPCNRHCTC